MRSHPLIRVTRQGHRKRRAARFLLSHHSSHGASRLGWPRRRVVCVSDTHNTQPILPPGDILIHAGDLTQNGSFDEIQAGLSWLSAQPHPHKIFVAGSHDVLLDDDFMLKHPEMRDIQGRTKANLDWGDVIYLQDEAITLSFPARAGQAIDGKQYEWGDPIRKITIFGSPRTPGYRGSKAFQYDPDCPPDWTSLLDGADLVVTHGAPHLHLDEGKGCPHLADAIAAVQPQLVVFGQIHHGYGSEAVVLDSVRRTYENVERGWAGWDGVLSMALDMGWMWVRRYMMRFWTELNDEQEGRLWSRMTRFVNASVVGGRDNELRHGAEVVQI